MPTRNRGALSPVQNTRDPAGGAFLLSPDTRHTKEVQADGCRPATVNLTEHSSTEEKPRQKCTALVRGKSEGFAMRKFATTNQA